MANVKATPPAINSYQTENFKYHQVKYSLLKMSAMFMNIQLLNIYNYKQYVNNGPNKCFQALHLRF